MKTWHWFLIVILSNVLTFFLFQSSEKNEKLTSKNELTDKKKTSAIEDCDGQRDAKSNVVAKAKKTERKPSSVPEKSFDRGLAKIAKTSQWTDFARQKVDSENFYTDPSWEVDRTEVYYTRDCPKEKCSKIQIEYKTPDGFTVQKGFRDGELFYAAKRNYDEKFNVGYVLNDSGDNYETIFYKQKDRNHSAHYNEKGKLTSKADTVGDHIFQTEYDEEGNVKESKVSYGPSGKKLITDF